MARSVRDCALFLDAMSGFNPESPISYPACETGSFQDAVLRATPDIRIAFSPDLGGMAQVDAEVLTHLGGVMQAMEAAGAYVEETCPDLPNLERTYHTLRGIGYATSARRMPEAVSKVVKKTIVENVAFGRSLTIDDVADAHLDRTVIYNNMVRLFDHFDVLACPVVGCMPHPRPKNGSARLADISWTAIWTGCALPFWPPPPACRQYLYPSAPAHADCQSAFSLLAGHAARRHFLLLPAPLKWLWAGQNHQSIRSQRSHSVAASPHQGQ